MRVAVVFFPGNNQSRITEIAQGLSSGIEKNGHHVDLIDGTRDISKKLTGYGYIVLGGAGLSFFGGKISPKIRECLSQAGIIGGKKSFAYTTTRLFGALRVLRSIMAAMEHEGMFVRSSEVIRSRVEAELVGQRLKLDH